MSEPQDLYDVYYREKLWRLLPQVYRAEDSAGLDSEPGQEFAPGPLRVLTDRIGTQAAIVRRSIDRLWEDQSIESCDDWLIPYLADLLATNLISAMDARGQRLDVAKTIYYRRRKGTLGLLEELSRDVTGWDARCVEFFRRLGRARHGLDPPVGLPAAGAADDLDGARALLVAEMLIGPRTSTPAGGFADLRNAAGARRNGSPFDTAFTPEPRDDAAFDEYSHTLDVRRGRGASGWYNIPRLGVFLWRLKSLGVGYSTPVPVSGCPGPRQFTFDPNGRDVPLFAAGTRAYGDAWTSPEPWQLPAPLTRDVLAESLLSLYDVPAAGQPPEAEVRSLGVYLAGAVLPALVPSAQVTADPNDSGAAFRIAPESGRLLAGLLDPGGPLLVTYHYGFPSTIGAGPYDRRDAEALLPDPPGQEVSIHGGGSLTPALTPLAASGTGSIRIDDSLTYSDFIDLTGAVDLSLRAKSSARPVVRPAVTGTTWRIDGAGPNSRLVLAGLWLCGVDLVLDGVFDEVILSCCTFDPGNVDPGTTTVSTAADGRSLTPSVLSVVGEVRSLTIRRCVMGPVVANSGKVESVSLSDTTVQSLDPAVPAIVVTSGELRLSCVTVLGQGTAHRLSACGSILHDVFTVEDLQHGCVRFTSYAKGSDLPRPYESVAMPPLAPLFSSRDFGRNPSYAQLTPGADPRVSAGAEDGGELGAFARERGPARLRGLAAKLAEFAPLGLDPVVIPVT